MSEPTKADQLRAEMETLKANLQTAAGGLDEEVQATLARMEAILTPAA